MENDVLIDDQFSDAKIDITYSNGPNFSIATRVFGFILIVFGLAALLTGGAGYFIGAAVITAALFALTSYSGTDISLEHNLIREYNKSFGIKYGKWKSTSTFPYVSIIGNNKNKHYANFLTGTIDSSGDPLVTHTTKIESSSVEVVLLSSTHLKRIMLVKCDKITDALEIANNISDKMRKQFVKFNPQISESSKRKR